MSEHPIQNFFQNEKILFASGVNPGNNSSFIITGDDLKSKINSKLEQSLTTEQISKTIQEGGLQVSGSTGYGKNTRILEIVKLGENLFGLNTESNTREVLARYFQSFDYDIVYEFPDDVDSLQKALKLGNLLEFSKTNSRDLLAVKKINDEYDVWIIELKGHSGVESWDFFEGFKQIQRILDFRQSALEQIPKISIHCAFAIPGFQVKIHNGHHCYEKELSTLKRLLDDESFRNSKRGKRTYDYFFKLFDADFQKTMSSNPPVFHFLNVASTNSIHDSLSSQTLENFLN